MSKKGQVYKKKHWSERFWPKVNKDTESGCWEWTARLDVGGYGRFSLGATCTKAHRVIWVKTHGDIPEGMNVLHKCDNPKCVNPDHLFLGTHRDNVEDKIIKGRASHLYKKLTLKQVIKIKKLLKGGILTHGEIAERFDILENSIGRINRGVTWKKVII